MFQGPEIRLLLIEQWARLALTDVGFCNGLLLASCRHLSLNNHPQQQFYAQLAIRFKLVCLQSLSATISAGPSFINDSSIANVIELASDEVQFGDMVAAKFHVLGALKMVQLLGEPQTLCPNSFIRLILRKFIYQKGFLGTDQDPHAYIPV